MGFGRLFIPRRKENLVNALLILAFCVAVVIYVRQNGGRRPTNPRPGIPRDYPSPDNESMSKQNRSRPSRWWFAGPEIDRGGPGENGAAVPLEGEEKEQGERDMKTWFMNLVASDMMSLDRSIPDGRMDECLEIKYDLEKLPQAWSPLLRTVHSVVYRSPPQLLKEVILVDDNSQREELKDKLDQHIRRFKGLVRIIRKNVRHGLIRAKLAGAREATGDVIVFLDSHCEANVGWLEPLVQRISEKRSAIVCPMIDHISDADMSYYADKHATSVGGFSWALHFTWESMPASESSRRKSPTEYIRSPTMAGGLLAANREYFFEIGGYDEEMDIWGGENLEISFRVWMCGGSLEFIPCSHVGHIFRSGHPYNMTGRGGNKDVHGTNSKRLAEVWMDDYKRLYYLHRHDLLNTDVGDLTTRKELRKRLGCKSFKWYLDNVIPGKFVLDEDVIAYGTLFTKVNGLRMCTDTLQRDEHSSFALGVFHCQGKGSAPQLMSLSKAGHLRRERMCATVILQDLGKGTIQMDECSDTSPQWVYEFSMLKEKTTQLCLSTRDLNIGDNVIVEKCDGNSAHQKWSFVDPKL